MNTEPETAARRVDTLTRMLPLAGVLFAVLTVAGYLTIGEFPDASTPASDLTDFYRTHHANVALGGRLLEWSAVCFGLFAVGLAIRVRRSSAAIGSLLLVGAAVETMSWAFGGAIYTFLGNVGGQAQLSPSAVQALHAWGADFGTGAGTMLFAIGVATATVLTRSIPAWIGWSAVVLGAAALTPFGFFASLLFLLWAAVAGIVLAVRPAPATPRVAMPAAALHG